MTAEVAILNRHAIALAADSAVTVTGSTTKVYNTVNKLFTLSKYEPVGIMVYASADLIGVPVETVIKQCRSRWIKDARKDTLLDYAGAFFLFLLQDRDILTDTLRESDLTSVILRILTEIRAAINQYPKKGRVAKAQKMLQADIREQRACPRLSNYAAANGRLLRASIEGVVSWWASRYHVSPVLRRKTNTFLFEALTRVGPVRVASREVSSINTGVVVAGFGEKQAFPSLVEFELTYSAFNITKFQRLRTVEISDQNSADIVGFAQTDQIEAFMYGRAHQTDRDLGSILHKSFESKIDELVSTLDQAVQEDLRKGLNGFGEEVKAEFAKRLGDSNVSERDRLCLAISSLPKEELAMIAEALISLTIAKRRASSEHESVGPPVDVAVISKGDGFIWIKRKHYFEPKYNVHFAENYFRG